MHNNNNMNYSQDEYTEMNGASQDSNTGSFMEMVTEKDPDPVENEADEVTEADRQLARNLIRAGQVPNNNLSIPETSDDEMEVQDNVGHDTR
jgi:hypothetical protein